jgi:Outer membrane protein beta-barrel domain
MKKLILLLATAAICLNLTAQDEPEKKDGDKDTIRIGGMRIVKKGKKNGDVSISIGGDKGKKKKKNLTTNWGIVDLGFANYNDNTNYANAGSFLVNRPGYPALDKNDFKLKAGKSVNVNIWFFMQRLNLAKHHVHLKYGLGLELNNYRYKSESKISYKEGGLVPYTANTQTNAPFIFRDSISFSKNKLAADYLTVPIMLNFVTNADERKNRFGLSVGVSAGYLYSQRNKQVSNDRGKLKNKGDYDLERFKFSYVGELTLGPVTLYGSYSPKSMYEKSLDVKPFNIGFRLGYW